MRSPDFIVEAIRNLANGNNWSMAGTELTWADGSTNIPTKEAIDTEVARLQADYEAKQYQRDRAAEYPFVNDYLDGIVKGDQAQIDAYIAACQAVKAKYPKG